jgi:hypothetical protein
VQTPPTQQIGLIWPPLPIETLHSDFLRIVIDVVSERYRAIQSLLRRSGVRGILYHVKVFGFVPGWRIAEVPRSIDGGWNDDYAFETELVQLGWRGFPLESNSERTSLKRIHFFFCGHKTLFFQ